MMQHVSHPDRQGGVVTEEDLSERIADQQGVHTTACSQTGRGYVVGGEHNDPALVGAGAGEDVEAGHLFHDVASYQAPPARGAK
jgi:hypothetical protein